MISKSQLACLKNHKTSSHVLTRTVSRLREAPDWSAVAGEWTGVVKSKGAACSVGPRGSGMVVVTTELKSVSGEENNVGRRAF